MTSPTTQAQTADAVTQMQVSASQHSPILSSADEEVQPLQSSSSAFDVNDAEIMDSSYASAQSNQLAPLGNQERDVRTVKEASFTNTILRQACPRVVYQP